MTRYLSVAAVVLIDVGLDVLEHEVFKAVGIERRRHTAHGRAILALLCPEFDRLLEAAQQEKLEL